jgi:hypothetical protein
MQSGFFIKWLGICDGFDDFFSEKAIKLLAYSGIRSNQYRDPF